MMIVGFSVVFMVSVSFLRIFSSSIIWVFLVLSSPVVKLCVLAKSVRLM